ncbi:MAG: ATP-binding protein [Gemmatimonadetes bacterium]|nr:ATP-binding protein [Gemmatimonadota bacterium]
MDNGMEGDLILELPTDVRSIAHAVDYVMSRCTTCADHAERMNLNFRVGLTEALSNAMLYGNGDDPTKRVLVEVTMLEGRVRAVVKDQGQGFDPDSIPDPTQPENLTRSCGRGLFLMRELMDDVRYNDRGNEVTLILKLGSSGGALEGGAQA